MGSGNRGKKNRSFPAAAVDEIHAGPPSPLWSRHTSRLSGAKAWSPVDMRLAPILVASRATLAEDTHPGVCIPGKSRFFLYSRSLYCLGHSVSHTLSHFISPFLCFLLSSALDCFIVLTYYFACCSSAQLSSIMQRLGVTESSLLYFISYTW